MQIKDDFYVPAWIIQELFKNVDNVDIISYSICNLLKLGLIKEGNVKTAKILTNNSSLDELTEYLKCLYNNKNFMIFINS